MASYASESGRQTDFVEMMGSAVDAPEGYEVVPELARSGWKVRERVEGCYAKVSRDVYAT